MDITSDSIKVADKLWIDSADNLQIEMSDGSCQVLPSYNLRTVMDNYEVTTTAHKYLSLEGLEKYDECIKQYIDKKIEERLSQESTKKYKVVTGE